MRIYLYKDIWIDIIRVERKELVLSAMSNNSATGPVMGILICYYRKTNNRRLVVSTRITTETNLMCSITSITMTRKLYEYVQAC